LILQDAVSKHDVMRRLTQLVARDAGLNEAETLAAVEEREAQGSTFLNEGVALPHARIAGLASPQIALALTRAGILDAPTPYPVETVFLFLSPAEDSGQHLQMLAAAGRLLQDRTLLRRLRRVSSADEALAEIRQCEEVEVPSALDVPPAQARTELPNARKD
jgi:mannitol/fructose-specific phosphotransferase system IIA component (Ntr-type)